MLAWYVRNHDGTQPLDPTYRGKKKKCGGQEKIVLIALHAKLFPGLSAHKHSQAVKREAMSLRGSIIGVKLKLGEENCAAGDRLAANRKKQHGKRAGTRLASGPKNRNEEIRRDQERNPGRRFAHDKACQRRKREARAQSNYEFFRQTLGDEVALSFSPDAVKEAIRKAKRARVKDTGGLQLGQMMQPGSG